MKLSEIFKPICVEEAFEENVYSIALIGKHEDLELFGREVDGDNYKEDCWKCVLTKGNNDWYEAISYITNEGEDIEYCKVDNDFRNFVFKELNI